MSTQKPLKISRAAIPWWRRHSLSLTVCGFVALWTVLYLYGDAHTHRGAFYGNAIADWTGTLLIILVSKYLHERGSTESRPFADHAKTPFTRFLVEHSLSLFLLAAVGGSLWWFLRTDPDSKWGAVAGNLVSQFVQLLGLVLLTKKLFEGKRRS